AASAAVHVRARNDSTPRSARPRRSDLPPSPLGVTVVHRHRRYRPQCTMVASGQRPTWACRTVLSERALDHLAAAAGLARLDDAIAATVIRTVTARTELDLAREPRRQLLLV